MRQRHYDGAKAETTQGWYMVKSLSIVTMGVHAAKSPTQVKGSTTIPWRETATGVRRK